MTVASGKKRAVLARHVRNRRLYDEIDQWAFCALQASPGARTFYDHRRGAGDLHHQALRALGNRLVGILHGCLRHHTATTSTKPGHTDNPRRSLTRYDPGMSDPAYAPSPCKPTDSATRPHPDVHAQPGSSKDTKVSESGAKGDSNP